ncbi:MAG TPA: hypothetical protein VHZ95_19880 [Polyangiales bacterium]|jgi:hypothetical protein|nr:hypothetical protein [Polyangiales bacterium]
MNGIAISATGANTNNIGAIANMTKGGTNTAATVPMTKRLVALKGFGLCVSMRGMSIFSR